MANPTRYRLLIVLSSLMLAAPAMGQWVWKDEAGHVMASDQPPPNSVPPSRIIKEPRARPVVAPPVAADRDAKEGSKEGSKEAPKDVAKAEAPKSQADRELDAKQHQKEAAEAAKKADDEANKAKAMQENCTSVRSNLTALQAGGRAARFNDKGERVYLDDTQRANEIQKSQGQIAQYCK